jgi:hypothetical protein
VVVGRIVRHLGRAVATGENVGVPWGDDVSLGRSIAPIISKMPVLSAGGGVGQASRTCCISASPSFPVLRPVP